MTQWKNTGFWYIKPTIDMMKKYRKIKIIIYDATQMIVCVVQSHRKPPV